MAAAVHRNRAESSLIGLIFICGVLVCRAAHAEAPTVELTQAPAPGATVLYRQAIAWQGHDADGSVTGYRVAIDPPQFGEPFWIPTAGTSGFYFFRAGNVDLPIPATGPVTFSEPHMFEVEAIDNDGLYSDAATRSFNASTVAPEVTVVEPIPNPVGPVAIGTGVLVRWTGTDSDGAFSQRPVRYRYALFNDFSLPGGIDNFWAHPDLVRQQFGPDFAGWSETSGDTASVQFTNLILDQRYLFCVVGFDEAGAFSARFKPGAGMVQMLVSAAPARRPTWGELKRRYR